MNKKILLLTTLAGSLFFSGCTKDDLDVNFSMDAATITFTVNPTPVPGEIDLMKTELTYKLDSICGIYGVNKNQIQSVKIREIWFDMLDNDNTTFDIVDFAEGYLSCDSKPETLVAKKNPVPKDHVRTLMLDEISPEVELADFVKGTGLKVRVHGLVNAPINNPLPMRCRISFDLVASPIN